MAKMERWNLECAMLPFNNESVRDMTHHPCTKLSTLFSFWYCNPNCFMADDAYRRYTVSHVGAAGQLLTRLVATLYIIAVSNQDTEC